MATIKILGSCSGTEPMPERHHTSIVLTASNRNYFFDAGENCSYSSHLSKVDLTKTRAVFISHTHYDHIGGLMGLFWVIRKISGFYKRPVADGEIKLFIPDVAAWEHILGALKLTEGDFKCSFDITADTPKFGQFYKDENLTVSAFESHHLAPAEDGHCRSFSYRIETAEKSIVFSGDIKNMDDLLAPVGDGCDLLLCETGHHTVKDVCDFAETHNVKHLVFVHHGREILGNHPTVNEAINNCQIPVDISFDGFTLDI